MTKALERTAAGNFVEEVQVASVQVSVKLSPRSDTWRAEDGRGEPADHDEADVRVRQPPEQGVEVRHLQVTTPGTSQLLRKA